MLTLPFDDDRRSLRVLALGAHADDIEIGCGGTVLRLAGAFPELEAHWVVLSGTSTRAGEARASAEAFLDGVAELEARGAMRPRGVDEVEKAKADGRWAAAYDSAGTMQVPPVHRKANVAAWYKYSVTPGQIGTSVIEGHVDTDQGPAVFFRLGALRPGDLVNVRLADGVELSADLVIDASGRRSKVVSWLAALGARLPHEESCRTGIVYFGPNSVFTDGSEATLLDLRSGRWWSMEVPGKAARTFFMASTQGAGSSGLDCWVEAPETAMDSKIPAHHHGKRKMPIVAPSPGPL